MLRLVRTNAQSKDFQKLVKSLDTYLAITDGDEHSFYDQFNKLEEIKYVVVAYDKQLAVGCGAIKHFDVGVMEVKRMFISASHRGQGLARKVLSELEAWAFSLGNSYCVLEVGKRQKEAIAFYAKSGFNEIENYGQYQAMENSQCFRKKLS